MYSPPPYYKTKRWGGVLVGSTGKTPPTPPTPPHTIYTIHQKMNHHQLQSAGTEDQTRKLYYSMFGAPALVKSCTTNSTMNEEKVTIAGQEFPSLRDAAEHAARILDRYALHEVVRGSDSHFIAGMLRRHPQAEAMIGAGFSHITVNHEEVARLRVHRTDSTSDYFTIEECVRSSTATPGLQVQAVTGTGSPTWAQVPEAERWDAVIGMLDKIHTEIQALKDTI